MKTGFDIFLIQTKNIETYVPDGSATHKKERLLTAVLPLNI